MPCQNNISPSGQVGENPIAISYVPKIYDMWVFAVADNKDHLQGAKKKINGSHRDAINTPLFLYGVSVA